MIESGPFVGLQGGYQVILADPPWNFGTYSAAGHEKSAHAHYTCMSLDDIKALPVADLAAPNCLLFLWTTAPHAMQAMEVMKAWGFTYSTMGAWAKQSKTGRNWAFGTGFRYRSAMEPWFLGFRGKPPLRSRSIRNLIVAPIREHSRKPDQMHADVEAMSDGPRLELFARARVEGWDSWGNQVDKFPAKKASDPVDNRSERDCARAA